MTLGYSFLIAIPATIGLLRLIVMGAPPFSLISYVLADATSKVAKGAEILDNLDLVALEQPVHRGINKISTTHSVTDV